MNHIIITNFFIDEEKFSLDIGAALLGTGDFNQGPNWDTLDTSLSSPNQAIEKLINQGNLLVYPGKDKENLAQNLLPYFVSYDKPTVLILGSLSSYSKSMQEGLLRFIEEPPQNLHIILTVRSKNEVLGTILSRCKTWFLPSKIASNYLDKDYTTNLLAAFPNSKDFSLNLIKDTAASNVLDFKKTSREGFSVWLWQLEYCLGQMYLQNQANTRIGKVLTKVMEAQKLNNANVLNRLVWAKLFV